MEPCCNLSRFVFRFTTMYFRSFLIFCLLTGTPLLAQQKAAAVSRNEEPMSSFQAVNATLTRSFSNMKS